MQRSYRFANWRGWDRFVDQCVSDFATEYGVAPNLLAANGVTLRRVNLAANKKKIGNEKGRTPDDHQYVELKRFAGRGYELWLIPADELDDKRLRSDFCRRWKRCAAVRVSPQAAPPKS